MESCTVEVAKAGYYLCLDHWKKSQKGQVRKCESCEVWMESKDSRCRECDPGSEPSRPAGALATATVLGKNFGISAQRVNLALAELGWIEKPPRTGVGWHATKRGKKLGAVERISPTGAPYVAWPENIGKNKVLVATTEALFGQVQGTQDDSMEPSGGAQQPEPADKSTDSSFRSRFPARYRTADGHMVRSRAEALIDNWLYMNGIAHAYERKLPIEEDAYCDFYINQGSKPYIEYWGLEERKSYRKRMAQKKSLYAENQIGLIEVFDSDIDALDDVLPRKLLDFGIRVT